MFVLHLIQKGWFLLVFLVLGAYLYVGHSEETLGIVLMLGGGLALIGEAVAEAIFPQRHLHLPAMPFHFRPVNQVHWGRLIVRVGLGLLFMYSVIHTIDVEGNLWEILGNALYMVFTFHGELMGGPKG